MCDIQANVSSVALHYPYILKTYLGLQSWHLDQVRARVLFSREGVKQSGKHSPGTWFILRAALKATSPLSKMTFYGEAATPCQLSFAFLSDGSSRHFTKGILIQLPL